MGFTTGFLGGLTLTYSILYLTVYAHKANRSNQHTILSQSITVLNSVIDPIPPQPDPPPYEVKRAGLAEVLKDRWNTEIERMVSNVQETNWNEKREDWERTVANAWGKLRETEKVREAEQRLKESVVGTTEEVKGKAQDVKEEKSGKRLLELS